MKKKTLFNYALILSLVLLAQAAWADTPITNWLQDPATPLARNVRDTFWFTIMMIMPFFLIAEGLLLYSVFKFRTKPGSKPATFHENVRLEIIWTLLPALTLIIIAIPAYGTLKRMEVPPQSDLVIEVVGHQFFWEYRYPKYDIVLVDKPLVVPVNKVITLNLTSVDVIHSWFVPAFGVKQDATPGRISNAWFQVLEEGTYKGQCAELCGELHAKMYITVKVVDQEDFEEWLAKQKVQSPPKLQTGASSS
ncbi:MAG: cytochrome c oxidase subunit II [candidate division Zixibacteria bacterium RBG_16_50_21]|nr:MAG: cytochrome c oxidase subunit II [candidate division Zixibacteria bacterium RBG_16_50_21]